MFQKVFHGYFYFRFQLVFQFEAFKSFSLFQVFERFFGLFEEHVHRLPSTLGSGPKDPRRQNPEEQALTFKIKAEHIEDLVEVLIALHNDRPTDILGNRSPLEQLDFCLKSNPIIPTLDEVKKRALVVVDEVIAKYNGTVVMVAHRVVNKVLICALLGLANSHFWNIRQDTCGITTFTYEDGRFILDEHNNTSYLQTIQKSPPNDF